MSIKLIIFLNVILIVYFSTESTQINSSWINYDKNSELFPIQNIPFGICKFSEKEISGCTRISNKIINLSLLEESKLLDNKEFKYNNEYKIFNRKSLNSFIELGRESWKSVRYALQRIFSEEKFLNNELVMKSIYDIHDVEMLLPVEVGDYTDFYSSKNHAFNMGAILRGVENALQPNWVHLPVGYHGRSSTIVVDNTKIHRPRGQIKLPDNPNPIFTESKKLDFEIEMGVIIGKSNKMGKPIKIKDAEDYIFGLVLLNDWSARDIQGWEYVPLGPFNAKNFATTISPWIITLEALHPFEVSLPKQIPKPLPYLFDEDLKSWDIPISVSIKGKNQNKYNKISTSNYKYMYWSINQQISHHTVSGCSLKIGDILGSGTISGNKIEEFGSLFELTKNGKNEIIIGNQKRTWIEDYDSINLNAEIQGDGYKIGFGDCRGQILPANDINEYY